VSNKRSGQRKQKNEWPIRKGWERRTGGGGEKKKGKEWFSRAAYRVIRVVSANFLGRTEQAPGRPGKEQKEKRMPNLMPTTGVNSHLSAHVGTEHSKGVSGKKK